MKKLSFIFAMVFAASMAMAQHVDVVKQVGTSNVSTVDQGFMPNPGPGLQGNEAYVEQIGKKNTSDVDQWNNGYAGAAHYADVYSRGDNNVAVVKQINDGGDAIIEQIGDKNTAKIFQSGNFYSTTTFLPKYDAVALQKGSYNTIDIVAWGTNATAYAEQFGYWNKITQDLGQGNGEKVQNSSFIARQYGIGNKAVQMMEGQGWAGGILAVNNNGDIYQKGDANCAEQHMHETATAAAAYNTAKATQLGDWNVSVQHQAGAHNSSVHAQTGNYNSSITTQN